MKLKFWSFDNLIFVALAGMIAGLLVAKDIWANYTGHLIVVYMLIILSYRVSVVYKVVSKEKDTP